MDPVSADDIIDRQRLRRKVTFWRVITFLAAILCVASLAWAFGGEQFSKKNRDHIARINVNGTIVGNRAFLEMVDEVRQNNRIKAAIVAIDSPGGTTAGSEALFEALRKLAAEKPIVTQINTIGASGGYMVATAADHIVARHSSIVGSIGVIVQYPNVTDLLQNWGIEVDAVKSSPLKAEPSPFDRPPPEAVAVLQRLVDDSFQWFKDLVAERRGFDTATIDRLANGAIYSGRDGLQNGLVDALGGQQTARAWLTEQGVSERLDIVDWSPERSAADLLSLSALARQLLADTGLGFEYGLVLNSFQERMLLDGLVSLWHAGATHAAPAPTP